MIFQGDSKRVAGTFLTLGALGLSLLISAPAWAQVTGATVSGTVTDASGARIPQAQISIRNVATGINTAVTSNADGFYTAPNLLPGAYEMSASAPGFATVVQAGITLTVGAQQVLNFTLQVGQVTQKVEVTGVAPAVQLASSSISAVVGSNTMVELPLNGRDWTQLATLQPGVNAVLTQATTTNLASRGNRGFGNAQTISGTRPVHNNYRIDGISVVGPLGDAPGSVASVALGVDAIAEFSVITSNYSAEYGRTSGGVVNAITRSGTNQIHGDAFWFLRDEGLDARGFFDVTLPPFHRNQFGASAGGPIQKDKTFFFADYEGFRQGLGMTQLDKVPSPDARKGIVHNADGTTTVIGAPGSPLQNSAGTLGVDPKVKPYLALYPLPNAGLIGKGNTGLFIIATNDTTRDDFRTVRIDRKMSDQDSIFGTWVYDFASDVRPDVLNNFINGNHSTRQMIALEETHIFSPSLVNSVRGGYSRVASEARIPISTINPLINDVSLGAVPGQGAPVLAVSGLAKYSGTGGSSALVHVGNSFQGYDDAFLTKGVHSLKFGFAFERIQDNTLKNNPLTGAFNFGSLTDFLTNQPKAFSLGIKGPSAGYRNSLFGGYLQDDWRWRSNLTLNLGLRYEMATVVTEAQNKFTNLIPLTASTPTFGSPLYNNSTLRNFEPRVGFSWDPFHDGKTAVRAAFGIFDVLPLVFEFTTSSTTGPPFDLTLSAGNLPPGSFPTGAVALGSLPSSVARGFTEFNPKRNYVMIWNLNVQRQLTPSTTVMVGYVGNHGVHMVNRADDMNDVIPTATAKGLLWPSPTGSGTRINPNAGDINGMWWGGDSEYDALEVMVSKKMSHGFQAQGSYTWGKGIDTGSASIIADPYTNSITSLFWFCKACRRGLSDYNIAQTLVVNYLWDAPTPKNWGAVGSHVLGGWEVGGIITAETGVPITLLIGGDPLGLNSTDPFAVPNRLTGPGCTSAVNPGNPNNYIKLSCFAPPNPLTLLGNAGRNTLVGPGLVNFDFSLFKNNYIKRISENFNVQFRAELFNILNHANFLPPINNETLFNPDGSPVGGAGALDSLSTRPREIQLALKLIW